jgi:hypothetical protein
MQDLDVTKGNALIDEVEVNLNMLCMLVLNRVAGHVHRTDVVTIHHCGKVKRVCNSSRSWCSQVALVTALATAWYSVFALGQEIVGLEDEVLDR